MSDRLSNIERDLDAIRWYVDRLDQIRRSVTVRDLDEAEAGYVSAIERLATATQGAVDENKRLRAALEADTRVIADLRRQLAGSDKAVREYFDSQRGR